MLKKLKILNIPGVSISNNCILKFITKSPVIEFIDISENIHSQDCENFLKNIIETLKNQSRCKPLTLRMKMGEDSTEPKEEKSFLKENGNILRIDYSETDFIMKQFDSDFRLFPDDHHYDSEFGYNWYPGDRDSSSDYESTFWYNHWSNQW
ncbi:uncharacterized protein LOC129606376 [Condylostylus longicornis]|uniref:uncharacterized protein LOC129606376 n=1 Tax=Condylostylus longicornis TaxID=2530218 RepID=UPI00244D9C11|nr:uncharacterized protein LOC129606376 [Condylostylus longicornis]